MGEAGGRLLYSSDQLSLLPCYAEASRSLFIRPITGQLISYTQCGQNLLYAARKSTLLISYSGESLQRYMRNQPGTNRPPWHADKHAPELAARLRQGLNDVLDPAQPLDWGTLTDRRRFEFILTDGTLYTVETGRRGEDDEEVNYLQFAVSFQADAVVPAAADASTAEKDDEEKEAAEGQDRTTAFEVAARQAHTRLSPWIFKISRWKHEAFVTETEALLEKEATQ